MRVFFGVVLIVLGVLLVLGGVFGALMAYAWGAGGWALEVLLIYCGFAALAFWGGLGLLRSHPRVAITSIAVGATLIGIAAALATGSVSACSARSSGVSVYADPRWSPDGSKIAFVDGYYNDVQGMVYWGEIVVMNADGSSRRPVAGGYNDSFAWSPDSTRIAFTGGPGGLDDTDLFVVDADGSNEKRLTDTDEIDEHSPSWSPDGRAIAYVQGWCRGSLHSCSGGEIGVIAPDGSNARSLTRTPGIDEDGPVWSPDGRMIAFTHTRSVADYFGTTSVMNADGTGRRKLAPRPSRAGKTTLKAAEGPAWSPDGTMIAFNGIAPSASGLYVANADGTNAPRLVSSSGGEPISWSPDGRRLVVVGDNDILIVNVDGTGLRNLTESTGAEYDPDLSPDGTKVAFIGWSPGDNVSVMNVDGTSVRVLAD